MQNCNRVWPIGSKAAITLHFSLCIFINTYMLHVLGRNMSFFVKSNSHAPNLHACIIYIRVNILPVCIVAHANANTHGS